MAYIGNDLQVAYPSYTNIDDISGSFDGVTTSFSLLVNGSAPVPLPLSSNQCLISVGGVIQRPDDSGTEGFRLSGGNIIFSSAPSSGEDFFGVILAGADYVNAGVNFPDGTLGAPSITFDQDNDTGYYRSASGAISFSSNGVASGTWDANGVSAPALIPSGSTVPSNGVYLPSANNVGIATNSTAAITVDSSQRVGIGTSTPNRLLTANGIVGVQASGTEYLRLYGQGGSAIIDSVSSKDFILDANGASNSLIFYQGGAEAARIDSSKRLLVGTSTAAAGTSQTASVIGSTLIQSTGLQALSSGGTLDLSLLGVGMTGHLYVTSTLTANANVRTSTIYFISTRSGNSTAITSLNTDNGSGGGRTFTITNPSGNIFRFTDTSSSACHVSMSFVGAISY